MRTSHVRNIDPMIAKRRLLADQANESKAVAALLKLGWTASVTEHGRTLTEPRENEPVKTYADA